MKAFVAALVLVAVLVGGVAVYQGWIVVKTERTGTDDGSSYRVQVDVHRDRAREDIEKAGDAVGKKTSELAEKTREGARVVKQKAQEVAGLTTLEGEVMAVNPEKKELTLQVEEEAHTIRVEDGTAIRRGDERISLKAVKTGEKAVVEVQQGDPVLVARSVTVKPRG